MFYRLIINEAALWTGTLEYRWIKKKQQKKKKKLKQKKTSKQPLTQHSFLKEFKVWSETESFFFPYQILKDWGLRLRMSDRPYLKCDCAKKWNILLKKM